MQRGKLSDKDGDVRIAHTHTYTLKYTVLVENIPLNIYIQWTHILEHTVRYKDSGLHEVPITCTWDVHEALYSKRNYVKSRIHTLEYTQIAKIKS